MNVNILHATISGNTATGSGGGLWSSNTILTVRQSVVENNEAGVFGGGVYLLSNATPIVIRDTDILGNRATGANSEGGGIFNYSTPLQLYRASISGNSAVFSGGGIKHTDGNLLVYGSTINGNTTDGDGGGIQQDFDGFAAATTMSVQNSTLSGNIAQGNCGAIFNDFDNGTAEIYLFNVTIAANDAIASASDGVFLQGGLLRAQNSVIGRQVTPGADCMTTLGGVILSPGTNLEEGGSCGFSINSVFPGMDPLADNGGRTLTHALQMTSPAIDTGNPAGCPGDQNGDGAPDIVLMLDQRDIARGQLCDLGAYEFP